MSDVKELKDEELEKVSGGESHDARGIFEKITIEAGYYYQKTISAPSEVYLISETVTKAAGMQISAGRCYVLGDAIGAPTSAYVWFNIKEFSETMQKYII